MARWRGVPLASRFVREYRVGPAIERVLDTRTWTIAPPRTGSREPLIVDFPWPLDHALLQRALSVARGEAAVPGDATIQNGERHWVFRPRDPWQPGAYRVVALPELEDVAGNRVGHAFETLPSGDDTHQPPARCPSRSGDDGKL